MSFLLVEALCLTFPFLILDNVYVVDTRYVSILHRDFGCLSKHLAR